TYLPNYLPTYLPTDLPTYLPFLVACSLPLTALQPHPERYLPLKRTPLSRCGGARPHSPSRPV
ncbi:hypothetical protein T484DRAFT_1611394, partial [Baffinella frigidus]